MEKSTIVLGSLFYSSLNVSGMTSKHRSGKLEVMQFMAEVKEKLCIEKGMDIVVCLVEETHQVKSNIWECDGSGLDKNWFE
jgi:hypothetical protein